jgi:long-chain fatty acid transport protein
MLGATLQLSNFVLGAAAYAPFGGNVSFDENAHYLSREYPGARDGVARWHGIDGATMSIYTTLGVAYRLGCLSFGVTGNLILTSLHLTRAQTLDGTNDLKQEGRSQIDVSGVHGSFGLGVMLEVLPERLYLSASYQAQPGLGVQKLDGALRVDSTVHDGADSFTRDVTFHQALPDIWRLGARFKPTPSVELRLAADLTRWSVLQTQCVSLRNAACVVTPDGDGLPDGGVVQNIRRYWRDTVGVRVGASMWVTPALELFAGLGYEMGASPDRTLEPVLADGDNMAVALGGRIQVAHSWFLAAGYTHLQFLPRDNTGKSQLADPFTAALTRRPDAGGQYEQWVAIVNMNVTKTF